MHYSILTKKSVFKGPKSRKDVQDWVLIGSIFNPIDGDSSKIFWRSISPAVLVAAYKFFSPSLIVRIPVVKILQIPVKA